MRFPLKCLLALGFVSLLSACDDPGIKPVATSPDIVTVKLAQAADKASAALDSIAGIEQYRNPAPPPDDYSRAPSNLMQPVTIRWSGPIEAVTHTLAERAGMKFHVKGAMPASPLTVSLDVYQQPLMQVLRDVGLQAGTRADVSVDANAGVIELRYAAPDAGQ